MTVKEQLHSVVEELSDAQAEYYLEQIRSGKDDALLNFLLNAPTDDERTTPEDDADADAGWQEYLRGETKTLRQVLEDGKRGERSA